MTRVRIEATEIRGADLKPGDLFSTAGPEYWDHAMDAGIGERVWIRTNAPASEAGDADETVYRIRIWPAEEPTSGSCTGETWGDW